MMSEAVYADYVDRRSDAGFIPLAEQRRRKEQAEKERREQSARRRQREQEDREEEEARRRGYQATGYRQHQVELGEDPLTTIRTLRNRMRNVVINQNDPERPVKQVLCQQALVDLSATEQKLLRMNEKRSNALMAGDVNEAKVWKEKMNQVAEDSVRNTYADLVTEQSTMRAFGVDSQWAPEHIEPYTAPEKKSASRKPPNKSAPVERRPSGKKEEAVRETSAKPPEPEVELRGLRKKKERRSDEAGRFAPRSQPAPGPRKEEMRPASRHKSASRPSSRSRSAARSATRQASAVSKTSNQQDEFHFYEIKRNGRLSDLVGDLDEVERSMEKDMLEGDDPYKLPNTFGKCPYCDAMDKDFGRAARLEQHFKDDCKLLPTCQFCNRVVLVSQLSDHQLNRCEFVQGKLVKCSKCGMAIDDDDEQNGRGHPLCRGKRPPSGAQWCPLCGVAVDDHKQSWKTHMIGEDGKGCYNNPRRHGTDRFDEDARKKELGIPTAAEEEAQRREQEEKARVEREKRKEEQEKTMKKRQKNNQWNGNLIDADKLVKELEVIQEQKKADKKRKIAAAAAADQA